MLYVRVQKYCELIPIDGENIKLYSSKGKNDSRIVIGNRIIGKYHSEEKAKKVFYEIEDALSKNQSVYAMPNDE